MGDDILELSTENDSSKDKIGFYDEDWIEESKAELLKQIDDEERASLVMSEKKNRLKNNNRWLILVVINYGEVNFIKTFLQQMR